MSLRSRLAATISGHLVYPERASGRTAKALAEADRHMVATAHPLATEAGLAMLRAGGTAADAAVASALMLAVVEPQSSGLGGGGYALVHHPARGALGFDGREAAPAASDRRLFQVGGATLAPEEAARSGRSIGVPGLVPMLAELHAELGRLPWEALVEPALAAARDGFPITRRLVAQITSEAARITGPALRRLLLDGEGRPRPEGYVLRQPDLAEVLARVARTGARALTHGEIAAEIVHVARAAPFGASPLRAADLAAYRVRPAPVVSARYRGHEVIGLAGSTAGGPSLLQILGLLERFDLGALDPLGADAAHLVAEASNHAFADRFAWLGDGDDARARVPGLLDPAYLAARSAGIDPALSCGPAAPGDPARPARRPLLDEPSTTHLSVVDAEGGAVSLTQSIGLVFGAQLTACGIVLNDQLVAFSPPDPDRPGPNEPAPGRRPLSSMAPTLVLDGEGGLRLVTGSPGSSAIIGYVAKSVTGVLDWGLDVQAALDLPNVLNRNGPTELEADTPAAGLADALRARGHDPLVIPLTSGLHAIERRAGRWFGGADPRRDGLARGD